ncbi:MAG: 4,5-DOPA dioxygenase extradiol [Myxococcota bacterium]
MARPSRAQQRMPVLFVGHGSPMNAIEDNRWSRGFRRLAEGIPTPRAILAVSAHWTTRGTLLTADAAPRTIHDFGGFPQALHEVQYPARGRPELAERVTTLVDLAEATTRHGWGLDHGTWSVLRHMYPDASTPVVQMSLNRRLAPAEHLEVGRALRTLRSQGVLIVGSGNIVHNLRDAIARMRGRDATPRWAMAFDQDVTNQLRQHDHRALSAQLVTPEGRQAHPTPEHFLPLLVCVGASDAADDIRFPVEGFDWGSISMRSVLFGDADHPIHTTTRNP